MEKVFCFWSLVLYFLSSQSLVGQTGNTVGLILNEEDSYNGYTILAPTSSNSTYLIDNCGYLANKWNSEYNPGLGAHLTPWGTMLRAGRIPSNFLEGGSGGLIQEFDWNGDVIWEAKVSNPIYHQHHDIKPLPNGNILVLAWEWNSSIDAMLLGRDPAYILDDGIWTEMILEIEPVGTSDYLVKWEWHLNDHLIQNVDSSLDNYGVISEHPELIDINYLQAPIVDLFHANAIDYNEELDQIVINFRNYNEFYIIDHSTTSAEAAGHSGGNSGQGGDILYRYGNPQVYGRGLESDQKFFSQHGANWVDEGLYKNNIIVFNNGIGRPQGNFSSVEIVSPTWNGASYDIEPNMAFGPQDFAFAYVGTPTSDFFSPRISNATVLPNDNILICNGELGQLFEVNQNREKVWEYINPVLGNIVADQGDNNPTSNVFATFRYGVDFSGLPNEIISDEPIEDDSDYSCSIIQEEVAVIDYRLREVSLVANPIDDVLVIDNESNLQLECTLYDLYGRQVIPTFVSKESTIIKNNNIIAGYYILRVRCNDLQAENIFKIIKR